jgi:CheY-like chemotaxis protein
MESLRQGFQDQFSPVLILDWSELDCEIPSLASQDLMVLRLEPDEDGRRIAALASVNKPILIAGHMRGLNQLNPEYCGIPFDVVAHPFEVAEVVWRAAHLLTRASLSGEPAPVAEDPPEREHRKTVRVMIAEDDPATATLLETVLSSHGMECHLAGNGEDALEMARDKHVDISILEVGLPGLDGFQILAAFKRDPNLAEIPVVFLTARQSEADILRAFGLGADDYITKPFSPMEVAARLKRLLTRSR